MFTKEKFSTKDAATIEDGVSCSNDVQYDAAVKQSYNEMFFFIRTELFGTPDVMTMTDLISRVISSLSQKESSKSRNQPQST